jgi:hypothetical protein
MKLKEGAVLNEQDMSAMACALRSIGIYFYSVCSDEDHPEELHTVMDEGMEVVNRLFD